MIAYHLEFRDTFEDAAIPQFDGGIAGGKGNDLSAAYGYSACHKAIGQRKVDERCFNMGWALARTVKCMTGNSVVKV